MKIRFLALAAAFLSSSAAVAASPISDAVKADWDKILQPLFIDFHKNPELSYVEKRTAGIMADQLRAAGATVTEGVGGTGVVGIMKNGDGPVILVRADMDGLPVKEATGLAYASKAVQTGIDGVEAPVMHACGHDVHITSLVGTARRLAAMKDRWKGTVVFVVQPAEERIGGARAMIEDGLYTRFPKPDYALGFHVNAGAPTGTIIADPGIAYSSSDSVDIIIHGVGTHGAYPHQGKDPIVMGAEIIMALQTLVSREISPLQPGVVTVGSFRGGLKHNIIGDKAEMQLSVRSDDEAVRKTLLEGIKRIAVNVGRMNGMPEDRLPEVKLSTESTPVTVNDAALTARLRPVLQQAFGAKAIISPPRAGMGAEDFAYFIERKHNVPGFYFAVGGTPQAAFDAAASGGPPVAGHHSPLFKIDPEPSVRLGTEAMTVAVLDLLKS
ncbi:amidohydrolase [Sphingosinicella rhizophila]|uniref:Amidohydrolase n=1 Tax=Sphingosinicella rhizophila TaxID=3050082 RepID=A0ABU3QBC7_9SPHN|nr:amidohydrolase [Sphingosinicella sp. GR2756]MDT9600701.1 amidohydrolase [Sphingosinicella sp. GR2756]